MFRFVKTISYNEYRFCLYFKMIKKEKVLIIYVFSWVDCVQLFSAFHFRNWMCTSQDTFWQHWMMNLNDYLTQSSRVQQGDCSTKSKRIEMKNYFNCWCFRNAEEKVGWRVLTLLLSKENCWTNDVVSPRNWNVWIFASFGYHANQWGIVVMK